MCAATTFYMDINYDGLCWVELEKEIEKKSGDIDWHFLLEF